MGLAKEFGRSTYKAGILSKVWKVANGVTIRVQNALQAKVCKVWIEATGGEFIYQFFGSEGVVFQNYPDPNTPGRLLVRGNACLVKMRAKVVDGVPAVQFKATPLVSSLRESPETPPVWPYIEDPYQTDNYLKVTPAHQPDGADFTKWYSSGGGYLLGTTWAQAKPHYAVGLLSGGVNARYDLVDSGFDFAPNVFRQPQATTQAPDSDWYREAAIQSVSYVNANGETETRRFIIMVDVTHVFYCYPLGVQEERYPNDDNDVKHNVPTELVKASSCPWPSWVSQEKIGVITTGANSEKEFRFHWSFNTEGTKACCVAYHRDEAWGGSRTLNESYPIQEDYPGIVEVGFTIDIYGDDLNKFSFTVDLIYSNYSKETNITPVAVGYANKTLYDDEGDIKCPRDSLIVLRYRHYIGYFTFPDKNTKPVLRRPIKATNAVVCYKDPDGLFIELRKWLACYNCLTPNVARSPQYGDFFADTSDTSIYVDPYDPYVMRPHLPLAENIPDAPAAAVDRGMDSYLFITQLSSIDLPTLSFSLCSTLVHFAANTKDLGSYSGVSNPNVSWGQSGVLATIIVYDQEVKQQFVGPTGLETIMVDLYGLSGTYPDFTQLNEFNMSATIDYTWSPGTYTHSLVPSAYIADVEYYFGVGLGSFTLNESLNAMTTLYDYHRIFDLGPFGYNLSGNPAVSGQNVVLCPIVYFYFDEGLLVRPGWVTSSDRASPFWNGNGSISGYPYGAIYHNRVLNMTDTHLLNVRGKLTVHPSGSYSVFAGPYAAGTGVFTYTASSGTTTVPSYGQFVIDVIYGRLNKKKENIDDPDVLLADGETTHLDVMNSCFELLLTEADYYMDLEFLVSKMKVSSKHTNDDDLPTAYFEEAVNLPFGPILMTGQITVPLSTGGTGQLTPWEKTTSVFSSIFMSQNSGVPSFTFPNPRMESVFFNTKVNL